MDNDKKVYSIVGKVEIGTDEYRDLIENNIRLEKENSNLYSKKWEIENEKSKLNKITIEQKKKIDNYAEFLKEKNLTEEFDLWIYKKELDEKSKEYDEEE